jgi:hypothetical protein
VPRHAWSNSIDAEANRIYAASANTKKDEKKETQRVRNRRAFPMVIGSRLIKVTFVPRDLCAQQIGVGKGISGDRKSKGSRRPIAGADEQEAD